MGNRIFRGFNRRRSEGLVVADSRTNGEQNEASEPWTYESWEKSCLAKFSDFLGFPTKGFEKEITNLLRNLVNAQKVGKGKECQSLSKSERELRKLNLITKGRRRAGKMEGIGGSYF